MAKKLTKPEINKILKVYRKYENFTKVSKITGFSYATVRRHAIENGLVEVDKRENPNSMYAEHRPPTLPKLEIAKKYKLQKVYPDQKNRKDYPEPPVEVEVIGEFPRLYKCISKGTDYITCINKCDMHLYEIKEVA